MCLNCLLRMNIVLLTTVVLTLTLGVVHAAEVLRGYMVAKDDTVCIHTTKTTESLAGVPLDEAGLSAACTLMSVQDGSSAGEYIIEEQGDNSKQVTLNVGAPTTFTGSGTGITFTAEGTMAALTGITSADVSDLTTQGTALYVASVTDGVDNTDCLKVDGNYHEGAATADCDVHLWYFKLATCSGSKCVCNPTPSICYECEANEAANTADNGCIACNGVTDCLTCDNDGSDGVKCLTCGSSKAPATDAASCVACSGVTGCESCSADNVCGKCTGSLLPNDNGSACYDCSGITNCEKCKADGECSACSSGMGPNAKGDACEATTTEATTASDAGTNTVSVLAIVGMALFTMA